MKCKKGRRYLLGGGLLSLGILSWFLNGKLPYDETLPYRPSVLWPLGLLYLMSANFVLAPEGWFEPIRFKWPKFRLPRWKPVKFLETLMWICGFSLLVKTLLQVPEAKLFALLGNAYFAATLWFFFILCLARRYLKEKQDGGSK